MQNRISAQVCLAATLWAAPAFADCTLGTELAELHDSYAAMIGDDLPVGEPPAPGLVAAFDSRLSGTVYESERDLILQSVLGFEEIALGRSAGVGFTDADLARHEAIRARLGAMLLTTDCNRTPNPSSTSRDALGKGQGETDELPGTTAQKSETNALRWRGNGPALTPTAGYVGLALIVVAALATLIGLHLRRRTRFRNFRRHAFTGNLPLSPDGNPANAQPRPVRDISRGGLKLQIQDADDLPLRFVLHLKDTSVPARVVWSNAVFAGAMFQRELSEKELRWLLENDQKPREDGASTQ